jgi:hypothetical protein
MNRFEAAQIQNDFNKIATLRANAKMRDVILCRRCLELLEGCKCQKCDYAKHTVDCRCLSLINFAYDIAIASKEDYFTPVNGFLV